MSSSPSADADTATLRRSSGRVRKQPTTIYANSSPSSSKRKRSIAQGGDSDVDMGDDQDESSDDASDEGEPDEEEMRETKARSRKQKAAAPRKPAQKKAKVNGTTSLPFRGAPNPRKKVPKKAKQRDDADAEEAGGVYAEVFAHGKKLEEVASNWIKDFDQHESRALADVINFVLKSAGCSSKVTEHDIEDPDGATNRLSDLQDDYQSSNPTDYPIIAKGKGAVSFKQSVTGFMTTLVKTIAAKGLIYKEETLLENVQVWLSAMSSAANRSFRHTSTVFALSVVTGLCEVTSENAQKTASTRRHAETEAKKSKVNKARVSQINQQAKELNQKQEYLESLLKDWFDTIFIHRYRDIDPAVRRDCVSALGDWVLIMPDVFFDGGHLRYLGWVLSDTSAATRGEVLKQLCRFYNVKDMLGGLKTFTDRFRVRMVEIATSDAETSVRAVAVELLDLLRDSGMLEPNDIDAVGRLAFDTDAKVRKAVASFVAENISDVYTDKIDTLGGQESLEEALPDADEASFEAPRLEWLMLKSLAEILAAYDDEPEEMPSRVQKSTSDGGLLLPASGAESRFSLASQTLYDTIEEIQDWQVLAGYLLFDHSSGRANGVANDTLSLLKHECTLTETEEMILLEVLNASVKKSLSDMADKSASAKSKLTKKQREELREEQEETSRQLASLIPKLLRKFGDSSSSAAAILRLESILSMPSLHELRQDSATVTALLDDIRRQFMAHSTDEVLEPASNAILHAKSYGDLDDVTEEKIAGLWEDVVSNLAELLNPTNVLVRGVCSYEELVALSNNLLRIIRLSAVSDCSQALEDQAMASSDKATSTEYKGAIDYLIGLIQRAIPASEPALAVEEASLEDLVSARAAEAALFYFRWKLRSIADLVTSPNGSDLPYEELEALATRRDNYVGVLQAVLDARKSGDDVCHQIAGSLLDVYSSAAMLKNLRPRDGVSDDYTVLCMDLEAASQKSTIRVFAAVEKAYAKLSGKRLEAHEADADAIDDDPESESESEDEDEPTNTQTHTQTQTQTSQQRRDRKLLSTLLAEQRLCQLGGKFIHAVAAGVIDVRATRKRLELNKLKLGANFKEVLAYLDLDKVQKDSKKKVKGGGKSTGAANGASRKGKSDPKSNAIVAEDEIDDEIEDADDDDEEALRRRELLDEPEDMERDGGVEDANGVDPEEESVVGD